VNTAAQQLVHTVRGIARDEVLQRWTTAAAVVRSVHGGVEHACTVELRESGLVLPRVPIAVGVLGAVALPNEGDLVVVAFAGGDVHGGIVIGRLYDEQIAPPEHGPGQVVLNLPAGETADDSRLVLTVDVPGDGTRSATLTLGGTVTVSVTIDDGGVVVKAGEASLALQQSSSSDGTAKLEVGGSSVLIEQGGDVTVKATGTLTLQATNVEISGDATVKVAGQTIALN
jgi:phage baseplate assembly protein gpV